MARSPENYDYAGLNERKNGNEILDFRFDTGPHPYDNSTGVSQNIETTLIDTGIRPRQAKKMMFEALQALDEGSQADGGVDALQRRFAVMGVTHMQISNGTIRFFDSAANEVLSMSVVSSRQRQLELARGERDVLKRGITRQRSKRSLAREAALIQLGPPVDPMATPYPFPRLKRPPFFFKTGWIRTGQAPEYLPMHLRGETHCADYVEGALAREIGYGDMLKLGLSARFQAWEMKHDLMQKDGVEVVEGMSDYLRIGRSSISVRPTNTEEYNTRLLDFAKQVDELDQKGGPVVLPLMYRGSRAKGAVVARNRAFKPEERSYNTHVAYCLGKEYKATGVEPRKEEGMIDYLMRALNIKSTHNGLLERLNVRVDGRKVDFLKWHTVQLNPEQTVEVEDLYFAHHFGGAKMHSLTEMLGNGKYVPTDALRLKVENLEEGALSEERGVPGVTVEQVVYLKRRGETARDAFVKATGDDSDETWDHMMWYMEELGIAASSLKLQTSPIPIPNLEELREHVESLGGIEAAHLKHKKERAKQAHAERPDIHYSFVERGENGEFQQPWDIIGPYFTDMDPALNKEEKRIILRVIDEANPEIDLRELRYTLAEDGELVEKVDIARWQEGDMIVIRDAMVYQLKQDLEYKRIVDNIHIPETLTHKEKEIEVPEEYRVAIENATVNDPHLRLIMTLALLNEDLIDWKPQHVPGEGARKWAEKKARNLSPVPRRWLPRIAEKASFGAYKEGSVGLFQVVPLESDMAYVETLGYEFEGMDEYREALLHDKQLNTYVAAQRFREIRDTYDYYLDTNGEEPENYDKNYLSGILTLYTRPPARFYRGMFGLMGNHVNEGLALGVTPLERVDGSEKEAIPDYWNDLLVALNDQGVVESTSDERDEAVRLIREDKVNFLRSPLYKRINAACLARTGVSLTMVISDDDQEAHAVQNYGYKVTRSDMLPQILDHSKELNDEELDRQGRRKTVYVGS